MLRARKAPPRARLHEAPLILRARHVENALTEAVEALQRRALAVAHDARCREALAQRRGQRVEQGPVWGVGRGGVGAPQRTLFVNPAGHALCRCAGEEQLAERCRPALWCVRPLEPA